MKKTVSVASQWQLIRWRFLRHKLAVGAAVVLAVFYLGAIFAEFVGPYDPSAFSAEHKFRPPQGLHFFDAEGSFHFPPFAYGIDRERDPEMWWKITYKEDRNSKHPLRIWVHGDRYKLWGLFASDIHLFGIEEGRLSLLGTNDMGQDMLSRIIHGARISLSIGLVGVAVTFLIGITVGGISGYFGGRVDLVIQRLIEAVRCIPTLPLWMGLSVALPPHWSIIKTYCAIVLILSVMAWTSLARVVRGKFMAIRDEDFVMAAKLHGASEGRIIFKHLLPSFYSYIIASLTLSIPGMILGETALSFIGLGLQAPAISWGVLLKETQNVKILSEAPWLLIPGIPVIAAILAFNFVGDGLRDAADPYTDI